MYKITIRFDEIDFSNNFNTTIRAILDIAQNLIIGSSDFGEAKSMIVHLLASEYETVNQMYLDLIQVFSNSNQISGNMSLINTKAMQKDSLLYSLGLIHSNDSNLISLTRLVNYIPQILEIT